MLELSTKIFDAASPPTTAKKFTKNAEDHRK